MNKKDRKKLLLKVHSMLRNGIRLGDTMMIEEAYRWYQDLMLGDGICVIDIEMPKWPSAV